jgi:ribosomal protein L15
VSVEHASAKAIEKIESAGGSVTLEGDDEEWEEE